MNKNIFFLLLFFLSQHSTAFAQEKEILLVQGNPPLTQLMVGKTIVFLDWVLDLKLTREQENKIGDVIQNAWKQKNKAQIKSTLEVIDIYEQIVKLNEIERNKVKAKLQPVLIENFKKEPKDELTVLINSFYQSSRSTSSVTPADHSKNNSNTSKNTSATTVKNTSRVGADGFTGIYRMLRPKALNINSTIPESGFYIEHITFLPGGFLYWDLPPEGLLYFDAVAAQRTYPNDWGTYEIVNDEIHVLRGPQKTKYVITRNGERLNNPTSLGKGSFRPIPSCDGLKLDGDYRRDESEPTISFTKDGRFTDGGVFHFFGTIGRLDGSSYMDDGISGSGTYIIEQNTLELKYSDGRVKRFVFEAFPENLEKKTCSAKFFIV